MSWQDNINTVKEIYSGHYQIILDFATTAILPHLLSTEFEYVWIIKHEVKPYYEWHSHSLPIFEGATNFQVLSRQISFDVVMLTKDFINTALQWKNGITLIQVNTLPKYYLDPKKIKGKTFYDLLKKECDYLFEIDLPSVTDYGTLISSNKEWIDSLLKNHDINWNDLP